LVSRKVTYSVVISQALVTKSSGVYTSSKAIHLSEINAAITPDTPVGSMPFNTSNELLKNATVA